MADLTGSTIASTYKDLLQVSNSNSGIDSTLRVIEDGEGTESILSISSSAAKISSSSQLQFRDSAIHISSDADGYLNVQADTGVNINIGGTDELAVTATTSTFGTNLVIPDSGTIGNASDTDLLTFTSGVLTVAGELDATTLDISGNADIDGTLEADAITVDGVALATFIRDTVGTNMLSSNTESGITVTYDTSNDNIDFSIDAAQTTITSLLATDIKIGEDDQTKIDFETADEIHFYAANVEQVYLGDNIFGPQSDSDVDLGSTSVRWKDAFVDSITVTGEVDGASLDISGDADIDGTLEADAITVNGTALSSVIAGTTVTLASTVTVTDSTANTNFPVVFHNESNALLDDTGALRYNPSTGTLLVPNLSVAGTTTTVDTVTMEASNAIIFEGATADSNETTLSIIDPTGDRTINLPNQSGTLPVLAAASTTQISSTPEELNILDGATVVVGEINALDLGSTAVGNAIASKAVILDSNKDYTGIRNFTITGELDAGSLDISGDVDVDGTLEADAVTIDGTALAEFISDTTGAMFSSNTETGITATYQDGDNTIDLAINASQTTITSLLATDIVIGEDAETKIDFETANEIHFDANNAEKLVIDGTATTTFQPIHFSGSDAIVQIKFTDSSQPADVFTMTSAEYSGGGGNKNKFSALNSTTLSFETGGAERLLIDQDDSVTLGQGMNFGALHTNVSVGTSATEVFDVSDVAPANSTGDGIYLFNIVRRGGSYSTRFVGIFGVDDSSIALINTIESNDFTISVSGMSLRAATGGTYDCSATFQPLAIGD